MVVIPELSVIEFDVEIDGRVIPDETLKIPELEIIVGLFPKLPLWPAIKFAEDI